MTAIRLPVSFVLALCATATLFWFLGVLVSADPSGTFIRTTGGIDFSDHVPETPVVTKLRFRPPIPKPQPPPDTPPIVFDENPTVLPGVDPSKHGLPDLFGDREIGIPRSGDPTVAIRTGSDRGPMPQVRIEPEYPASARDRGIEGWITFRFTVATDGSVKDIAILDSQPPRVWDSATIRAVSTWKYQPAIRDGKPVEQRGLVATYRYELER